MKPVPMHPNLPEATTALGTVVKPKQWVECAHCKKLSPLEERKWVGLTDEEIENLWGEPVDCMYSAHYNAIRDIEAKLKEKNA
jgi:hypothetical protein